MSHLHAEKGSGAGEVFAFPGLSVNVLFLKLVHVVWSSVQASV